MGYNFFTLHFNDELGNFDEQELQEFLEKKQGKILESQFFIHRGNPCCGILLEYGNNNIFSKNPSMQIKYDRDAYKKELEKKDWPLFEYLREWRKNKSDEAKNPVYIIMSNAHLAKIAIALNISADIN